MKAYVLSWRPMCDQWRIVCISLDKNYIENREKEFYEGERANCTKINEYELQGPIPTGE